MYLGNCGFGVCKIMLDVLCQNTRIIIVTYTSYYGKFWLYFKWEKLLWIQWELREGNKMIWTTTFFLPLVVLRWKSMTFIKKLCLFCHRFNNQVKVWIFGNVIGWPTVPYLSSWRRYPSFYSHFTIPWCPVSFQQ